MQARDFQQDCNSLPIMLALCLMLSGTYYVKNYASIIGLGLILIFCNLLGSKNKYLGRATLYLAFYLAICSLQI